MAENLAKVGRFCTRIDFSDKLLEEKRSGQLHGNPFAGRAERGQAKRQTLATVPELSSKSAISSGRRSTPQSLLQGFCRFIRAVVEGAKKLIQTISRIARVVTFEVFVV